ncbi:MAG: hypothetical protein QOF62_1466 [Pyrinomonadaceae bacterium]|jgi:uncharacterized protein YecE (DUF72 family)|nr:hypothetical protein [Pyrinomonadaceae bacterium]
MNLHVGTSGYSYKEWKGSFYPEKIPAKEMLRFYSERLSTVEINATFYRLPQKSTLENWKEQVPKSFRFSLKAPQRITHFKRLNEVGEDTKYFLEIAATLEDQLGVVLFQLPPNMKKDLPRLETFLSELPSEPRAAFEFRHPTWFDDDVLAVLHARNCALCISDTDDMPVTHIDKTADWGYLRLRRVLYSEEHLKDWLARVREQNWNETFVFFKHEDEGTGPRLAAQFLQLARD